MRCLPLLAFCLSLLAGPLAAGGLPVGTISITAPGPELAAELLAVTGPVQVIRQEAGVPGWDVQAAGKTLGHLASTWEVAGSVGYSGRPLDVLVAVSPQGRIAGARLMQHNEPVLTLGISDADIAAYVSGFAGYDLTAPPGTGLHQPGLPDVISRATVSTGVIRDGILRTARTLAIGRGLIAAGGGIDRLGFQETDWPGLLASGALAEVRVSMTEAARALAGAKVPLQPGDAPFLQLWAGLIDPPTVGQNLLGQQAFTQAIGNLGPGETALLLISRGLHSPRGTDWRQSGVFDRIWIVQGEVRHQPTEASFQMIKRLRATGAPEVKEISLFRLPAAIDPLRPFRIEVQASRPTASGEMSMLIATDYSLPDRFRLAPPPEPAPLWRAIWDAKRMETAVVAAMLAVLTLILFAQDWITRRPRLWRAGRIGFLLTTLVVLGWGLNGQLSVVQVIAFLHALLTGFRWETFLIEPVIFLLWGFTALGMLFWGRGVYCGWLCPFGALQELLNDAAVRLGIRQIAVPQGLHERLWVIKYTAFVGILALSFYSMHDALIAAEVEPFKTAISLRMLRAWPFVLFVLVLLAAGLFIERFYCRYLCPLGAAIAIPAKLKIFDWLKRRPQCGRECRLCETKCTVGAIDPLGRINANECVLCLRCQVIMNDDATCPVLKRRARTEG
ncbi:NosR/NirI family protein [Rhodobacter ferrooxidans]|uniref:Nitrous oxide expression regulator, NosR n=1 Tax=Rhodobacter ferrooxidans TaxID=371731 RepID=C8RWI3_9RHOB|nr:NosR/NirI family protein [Rhodobacter sp. SW2]EEW26926.1 nitrous oxide expression regulator, NosR [Rhodobacter sp. SW2]